MTVLPQGAATVFPRCARTLVKSSARGLTARIVQSTGRRRGRTGFSVVTAKAVWPWCSHRACLLRESAPATRREAVCEVLKNPPPCVGCGSALCPTPADGDGSQPAHRLALQRQLMHVRSERPGASRFYHVVEHKPILILQGALPSFLGEGVGSQDSLCGTPPLGPLFQLKPRPHI